MRAALLHLALCLCCLAVADCQRRRIESLPRLNFKPNFSQYSGYLTSISNRRLFYWLVESSHVTPSEAPLVLWMNGGPGCSSVGGLLMTNGPFLANDRAELDRNEFAWNRLANMLYIDSPSGVGLSEPGPMNSSELNDNFTTQLNLAALLDFFTLFPEYRGRPFYIAGESYAGIYIPLLASAIVDGGHHPSLINLTGISVGNGVHIQFNLTEVRRLRVPLTEAIGISVGASDSYGARVANITYMQNPYNIAKPCYSTDWDLFYRCLNTTGLFSYLTDQQVLDALGVNQSISGMFAICRMKINNALRTGRDVVKELIGLANRNVSVLLYLGTLDFAVTMNMAQQLFERLVPWEDTDGKSVWFYCLRKPGFGLQIGGLQMSYMGGRIRHRTVVGSGYSVSTDTPEIGFQLFEELLALRPPAELSECQTRSLAGDVGRRSAAARRSASAVAASAVVVLLFVLQFWLPLD